MRRLPLKGHPLHGAIWGAKLGMVVTLSAFGLGGCADMPLFHEPAQFVGLATTPKQGQDFIKDTHPDKTEFTSVGIETAKPPDKPRDAAGVKQLQSELQAQRDTGHAILQRLNTPAPAPPTPAPAPAAAAQPPAQDQAKAAASSKPKEQAAAKTKEKPKKKKTEPKDDDQQAAE